MKLKVQNSKRNLIQDILIVHIVRNHTLCTGYIVADAKDNEWEENREERNEGIKPLVSGHPFEIKCSQKLIETIQRH